MGTSPDENASFHVNPPPRSLAAISRAFLDEVYEVNTILGLHLRGISRGRICRGCGEEDCNGLGLENIDSDNDPLVKSQIEKVIQAYREEIEQLLLMGICDLESTPGEKLDEIVNGIVERARVVIFSNKKMSNCSLGTRVSRSLGRVIRTGLSFVR